MFGSSRSCLLFEKNVIMNINTNSIMMIPPIKRSDKIIRSSKKLR